MRMMFLLPALAAVLALQAANAGSVRSEDLTLHYSALPSTMIPPEVARAAGVTRSSGRALLNVAVRRDSHDGLGEAVDAALVVTASNEFGQMQVVRMREVREADAIYYLGEARITDRDTLDFDIEANVAGAARPIRVRFSQQFFTGP